MHEMSIAMSVIEIAEKHAIENNVKKILSVTVDIGDLAGVMADSLLFCYDACATGELVTGSRLHINRIEALAHCPTCDSDFVPDNNYLICPACSGPCGILQGEELQVRNIEAI